MFSFCDDGDCLFTRGVRASIARATGFFDESTGGLVLGPKFD